MGKEKRAWFIYSTLASPMAEGPPRVTRLALSGHCHRHEHLLWLIAQCCGPFSSGFARGCNTFLHSVCYESYRLQHLSEEMMLRHAPNQPVGQSTWDLPLSRRDLHWGILHPDSQRVHQQWALAAELCVSAFLPVLCHILYRGKVRNWTGPMAWQYSCPAWHSGDCTSHKLL